MYSNYNVLVLPIASKSEYKEGDTYSAPKNANWRVKRFDGLVIKTIDFNFGIRLHFDYKEWFDKKHHKNEENIQKNKTDRKFL